MSNTIVPLIPKEQYFFVCDGTAMRSIEEMPDLLSAMSDDTFRYHVNESKNDFVSWIEVVFADSDLADRMRKTKDRKETAGIIRKYLEELGKDTTQIEPVQRVAAFTQQKAETGTDGQKKSFENNYQDIWKRVSDIRKKGYDTKLAELMLMRIPPRIKIFAATGNKEDAKTVESLFDDLRTEIDEVLKELPVKVIQPENRET